MTPLEKIKTILESITSFTGKIAYDAFPEEVTPSMPYVCYRATDTDNFYADNIVYLSIQRIDIELYSKHKDPISEGYIELALNEAHIPWHKTEDYQEDEQCYQITYEVEV